MLLRDNADLDKCESKLEIFSLNSHYSRMHLTPPKFYSGLSTFSIVLLFLYPFYIFGGQQMSFRRTSHNLRITNEENLKLRSKMNNMNHRSVCVSHCRGKTSSELKDRLVAKFVPKSGSCECYSLEDSHDTLTNYSHAPKVSEDIYIYSGSIHPSTKAENPCETGTHSCEGISVCSFDGVQTSCLCPPGLNGRGIICTSYENLGPVISSFYKAKVERGDPNFLFDLNVHDFLLTEFDAFHCVEIGPITEEGEYDDEYGGDEESNKWQMRLDFVGSDRHYVKAVGFNNRRDELAVRLHPNFTTVSVCDFHGCLECEGAEENVTLRGDGGWNYVMCEHIGFYILVEVKGESEDDDLRNNGSVSNMTLGICEIEILGQKVAPGGKIVLPLMSNQSANEHNSEVTRRLDMLSDKLDRFNSEQCFPLVENRNQYISRELEFHFGAEKHVGYIQILAPYADSVDQMNLIQTFQCDNDSVCSHCDIMDTTNLHPRILPGTWISYECNHTLLATAVKVATAADTKSSSNLFVCGIDVFGKDREPTLKSLTVSDSSRRSIKLSFEVNMAGCTVNISLVPKHTNEISGITLQSIQFYHTLDHIAVKKF
ncbi:uncharacterized protein LOC142338093 [Convolutriloba macropyga]|uniref:uncharacterized protein LOC142338093 n=1 Tax=Convolutriloba macropyga TaxID=536237 RepID=UPI003F521BFE